jgi:hypothetical protein
MQTKSTYLAPGGVDPEELARHIAEMYGAHRKVSGRRAGESAGMHTNPTGVTIGPVDRNELDRHIVEMYRDVANEAGRDLDFPTGAAVRVSRHASRLDLGGGADVARAARSEGYSNTTTTEEVSK